MMTLYSNLEVTLTKMSVFTEPPPGSKPPSEGGGGHTGSDSATALIMNASTVTQKGCDWAGGGEGAGLERAGSEGPEIPPPRTGQEKGGNSRIPRQKYLVVRQLVTGLNRVSGKVGEWEVYVHFLSSPLQRSSRVTNQLFNVHSTFKRHYPTLTVNQRTPSHRSRALSCSIR
jgi:hypothetical protein